MLRKEQLPYDQSHIAIPLSEAIGKDVLCEDGVTRRVETIVHSVGTFHLALVNEDEKTERQGYPVHLLKLFHQLRHQDPPTESELKEFEEISKSWSFKYAREKPSTKKLTAIFKSMEKKQENQRGSFKRKKFNG